VEKGRDGCESQRVDICIFRSTLATSVAKIADVKVIVDAGASEELTFPVIAEAHLGLAKTNCVLPLTDAIELLELALVDTLQQFVLAWSSWKEAQLIWCRDRGRENAPGWENTTQWP